MPNVNRTYTIAEPFEDEYIVVLESLNEPSDYDPFGYSFLPPEPSDVMTVMLKSSSQKMDVHKNTVIRYTNNGGRESLFIDLILSIDL